MNERMSPRNRARARGLRLAARLTGIGGLALAVTGAVDAHAASEPQSEAPTEQAVAAAPADEAGPLPFETHARVGGCGCAPCWGPPAPPALTEAEA